MSQQRRPITVRIKAAERGATTVDVACSRGDEARGLEFLLRIMPAVKTLQRLSRNEGCHA